MPMFKAVAMRRFGDGQKIYVIRHTTRDGTRVHTEIAARSETTAILRWRLAYKHDTFISCEVTL